MEEPSLSGPVVALLGRYVNKNHSGLVLQERLGLTDHALPHPTISRYWGVFSSCHRRKIFAHSFPPVG